MLNQIVLTLVILMALLLVFLGVRRAVRGTDILDERLKIYAALPELERRRNAPRARSLLVRLRLRLNNLLSGLSSEERTLQLMSANWPITATEFALARFLLTMLGLVVGWWIGKSPLTGLGVAILVYILPNIFLNRAVMRRQRAFEKQLVDVLVLTNGAVRAGFSLMQALEVVDREIRPPASEEFRRVLQEVALGRPLSQALEGLSQRMSNKDLDLLITAINIQYQVGGNLTTMLNSVTETIRERIRLFGEVRVLTTTQRFSSYIISLLPFFVAGIMFIMNPEYMSVIFKPPYLIIPIVALIMIVIGFFIIQRMARIDI
jgi:tight adherence protein B